MTELSDDFQSELERINFTLAAPISVETIHDNDFTDPEMRELYEEAEANPNEICPVYFAYESDTEFDALLTKCSKAADDDEIDKLGR